jgi:hypothetical protein
LVSEKFYYTKLRKSSKFCNGGEVGKVDKVGSKVRPAENKAYNLQLL